MGFTIVTCLFLESTWLLLGVGVTRAELVRNNLGYINDRCSIVLWRLLIFFQTIGLA